MTDRQCRPIAFLLTGGPVADCEAAKNFSSSCRPSLGCCMAIKGYDTNPTRQRVVANGRMPNIPPKVNAVCKSCFSPVLYRARTAIERMFCRLKEFRRIATRYDRLAATIRYWFV
jgi:transposase